MPACRSFLQAAPLISEVHACRHDWSLGPTLNQSPAQWPLQHLDAGRLSTQGYSRSQTGGPWGGAVDEDPPVGGAVGRGPSGGETWRKNPVGDEPREVGAVAGPARARYSGVSSCSRECGGVWHDGCRDASLSSAGRRRARGL